MKQKLPWIIFGLFLLWIVLGFRPAGEKSEFNIHQFGKTPVLLGGRIKPIDTMARNALMIISGQQKVVLEGNGGNGKYWGDFLEIRQKPDAAPLQGRNWYQFSKHPKKLTAMQWLMEVAMKPDLADQRYIFRVHHPELILDLQLEDRGYEKAGLHWYTFNELSSSNVMDVIEREANRLSDMEPEQYSPYERQIVKLHQSMILYRRLKNSFRPENSKDFAAELKTYEELIPDGVEAIRNREQGREYDQEALQQLMAFLAKYQYETISRVAYPLIIPPEKGSNDDWNNIGTVLLQALSTGSIPKTVEDYARIASAYQEDRPEDFNAAVVDLQSRLVPTFKEDVGKAQLETAFNDYQPFLKSQIIYLVAILFALVYWLGLKEKYRKTALYLAILALVVHSGGIITRMVLEGRPPVTNLYSSAIFVGWGAVFFGLILEFFYKNAIGTVVASAIGFVTLMIAHYLSLSGDTLEMLQAVLDTNAWLATHVVTITLGYAATFVAGFLGVLYILLGVFTRMLNPGLSKSLARMVYGIVCFATLLSFVGTILGGIWADQSWGRFWGWDPKENGALIIVLWNAIILHVKWGGMVRERGLMPLVVFGNIVTSFSWFGVNLLGVGLHSYGFMEGSFRWLIYFILSQVVILLIGWLLPQKYWLSFRANASGSPPPPPPGFPREAPASAG